MNELDPLDEQINKMIQHNQNIGVNEVIKVAELDNEDKQLFAKDLGEYFQSTYNAQDYQQATDNVVFLYAKVATRNRPFNLVDVDLFADTLIEAMESQPNINQLMTNNCIFTIKNSRRIVAAQVTSIAAPLLKNCDYFKLLSTEEK
jgi:hypothetical protein